MTLERTVIQVLFLMLNGIGFYFECYLMIVLCEEQSGRI